MDGARERVEHFRVGAHELEELRPPGCQGNHVDQSQGRESRTMQQVCPQRNGATVVVGNDLRSVQSPMRKEIGQQFPLDVQRHPVVRIL